MMMMINATLSAINANAVQAIILQITKLLQISKIYWQYTGWAKNEATLHFCDYLQNYQRKLHDCLQHQRQCILNMYTICEFAHFIT